jgi:hypothetical protein
MASRPLSRFRDQHLPGRQRPITSLAQLRLDLGQEPVDTVFLDRTQGELVDTRRAVVAAHRDPATPQDVPAQDLVPQRVEPSPGIGLGRPVERVLQGTHLVPGNNNNVSSVGGTSRTGTHRAPP